jgi:hypothetical protein
MRNQEKKIRDAEEMKHEEFKRNLLARLGGGGEREAFMKKLLE